MGRILLLAAGLFSAAVPAQSSTCSALKPYDEKVEDQFPKSSDSLLNCGPGADGASNYSLREDPHSPYELHVIGVHEGSFSPHPGAKGIPDDESSVQVIVSKTRKPAILALSAARPVRWVLKVAQDADLKLVILQGRFEQKVEGFPPGVPVVRRGFDKACAWAYGWERKHNRRGGHYRRFIQSLRCATGLRESTFQGCKLGAVFEIPSGNPLPPAAPGELPSPCGVAGLEPDASLPIRLAARKKNMAEPLIFQNEEPLAAEGDLSREIRVYDESRRKEDRAFESEPIPPPAPKRRRKPKETLPAPKNTAARDEIPVRALAILLEGRSGLLTHDAIPDLILALERGDEKLRSRAADALGQLRPPADSAVAPLIKALKDESARVRSAAILALGNIGPAAKKSERSIRKGLKDESADVRYSAKTALERLGLIP